MVMPKSFVIFTTAYDEYSMQAIKNNGIDYLMKPIDFKELRLAMDRLNVLASGQHEESCSQLDRLLNGTHKYRERFLVNKGVI